MKLYLPSPSLPLTCRKLLIRSCFRAVTPCGRTVVIRILRLLGRLARLPADDVRIPAAARRLAIASPVPRKTVVPNQLAIDTVRHSEKAGSRAQELRTRRPTDPRESRVLPRDSARVDLEGLTVVERRTRAEVWRPSTAHAVGQNRR